MSLNHPLTFIVIAVIAIIVIIYLENFYTYSTPLIQQGSIIPLPIDSYAEGYSSSIDYSMPQTTTISFVPLQNTTTTVTYNHLEPPIPDSGNYNNPSPREWLPNTPFVYGSGTGSGTGTGSGSGSGYGTGPGSITGSGSGTGSSTVLASSSPSSLVVGTGSSTTSSSGSSSYGTAQPNTLSNILGSTNQNIINDIYSTQPPNTANNYPSRISTFQQSNQRYWSGTGSGNTIKEGIESLTPPPPSDTPGLPGSFVPKTFIVPPVCPTIQTIVINDCSKCPTSGTGTGKGKSTGSGTSIGTGSGTSTGTDPISSSLSSFNKYNPFSSAPASATGISTGTGSGSGVSSVSGTSTTPIGSSSINPVGYPGMSPSCSSLTSGNNQVPLPAPASFGGMKL